MAYNSESIKEAKEKYLLEMNDDALERLFRLLHSEKVIVICRSNMTEAQAASAGLKELEPDILRDAGGDFWFPVYSAESEIPPEARSKFSLLPMDFSRCIELTGSSRKLVGIVLDPRTRHMILNQDMIRKFRSMRVENDWSDPYPGLKKPASASVVEVQPEQIPEQKVVEPGIPETPVVEPVLKEPPVIEPVMISDTGTASRFPAEELVDGGHQGPVPEEEPAPAPAAVTEPAEAPAIAPAVSFKENPDSWMDLLTDAAEKGDIMAQCAAGYLAEKGVDLEDGPDQAAALSWYEKAADQGLVYAQMQVGRMCMENDPAKAFDYYMKAAKNGNMEARMEAARFIEESEASDEDYSLIRAWYLEAATAGDAQAQNNLGLLYAYGRGVEKDLGTAAAWFGRAAANGCVEAFDHLKNLSDLAAK